MDLNSLQTFVAVVRAGGFAAAARQTDTPRSSVSLRIRNLEDALGVRLFKRSTRAFSLTAEGAELYQRSAEALGSLTDALANISRTGSSYVGRIRVTVPADFPPESWPPPSQNSVADIPQCGSRCCLRTMCWTSSLRTSMWPFASAPPTRRGRSCGARSI